jgi:hypothetical protein
MGHENPDNNLESHCILIYGVLWWQRKKNHDVLIVKKNISKEIMGLTPRRSSLLEKLAVAELCKILNSFCRGQNDHCVYKSLLLNPILS